MKISGYYKEKGHNVILKLDYNDLHNFDIVYISKVFTDTEIPEEPKDKSEKTTENIIQYYSKNNFLKRKNIKYGGTGFFYDKAPFLPDEIEHHMPDYHLYDEWVNQQLSNGGKRKDFEYYLEHSIGYLTRKCFRGCEFCVNRNYKKVESASPLEEFLDSKRKYICLLDDNFLGYKDWKPLLLSLQQTNKRFQFKQGLDERLLTEEKVQLLTQSKYYGDYIFAFDNIEDKEVIINKLKLWREYNRKNTKFYIFCGFDRNERYDDQFFKQDIIDTFERIKILMEFGCLPYIMRHKNYTNSPYFGTYINFARWCNQPNFYKKMSYREYCLANQARTKNKICTALQYMNEFENDYPDIAKQYYDMKFNELNQCTYKHNKKEVLLYLRRKL